MTTSATAPHAPAVEAHRATLEAAVAAIRDRAFWSPHPESPRAYPADEGAAAFAALRDRRFPLDDQPGTTGWVGGEVSPYGFPLGVEYPHPDPDLLLPAMRAALPAWRAAGPETRALVCLDVIARINARSAEFAHAVMHTTGQAYPMALQAGGPHAQDRGVEAVAHAYVEQTRVPATPVTWTKPQGRREPLVLTKEFTAVPRGIGLVVGCNTFPTWNGYPGLFASLATGNPVLVKPHPRATLPLALTVRIARDALADAGFDPNLVALAAEREGEGVARVLALRPEIRVIDYTGSAAFGDWLEENAHQAAVFTEKSGVNTVVLDSTDDYAGLLANLAFSLALYSGQMCTTPQNLLIPRPGIATDQGRKTYDEVVADLAAAVTGLLADDARAAGLLGALVNPQVPRRLAEAPALGEVALASRAVSHPEHPDATVRTPLIVKLSGDQPACLTEQFGPITFAVAVDSTEDALALLRRTIREHGAMTVLGHTTSAAVERALTEVCLDECAQLSLNLTGGVYVNQTAAFSDFHGSGGNPAANASLVDGAFVAPRFRFVEVRRPA
ncbi:phenylacetic acid degradation protein PaaN [Streptomyces millisiae]|uniref:Phenylacetic acid degradation protein PaaN n=1 Tax=Streptomyces millisiae TaxID=3075542 RepID=A0ABU2LUD5_9ACTN|nr:phenylacetic acid degradation protein PaaN [Streptomyces sp. DSM 44918]MDT0320883.1 phenylacetic acid degradation protein PaaN [Streptomyces sp. DSM 44918]